MRSVAPGQKVLVFEAGPTLHHVFLAAEKASETHLTEYLPESHGEVPETESNGYSVCHE